MLTHLTLRNFALVEQLEIAFGDGLTLLTGETGAGKSILVEALGLILGGRADAHHIRSGSDAAELEAVFRLPSPPAPLRAWAAEEGVPLEEELVVQRSLRLGGRNVSRVNGSAVPAGRIRALAEHLVHLHGQHQSHALLDEEAHRALLDALPAVRPAAIETERAASAVSALLGRIRTLERDERERARRLDALRFQIEEIDRVDPRGGEEEELAGRRSRLRHARRIGEDASALVDLLRESEGAALSLLAETLRRMDDLAEILPAWRDLGADARSASETLSAVAAEAEALLSSLEDDPGALEETEARLAALDALKRKYGPGLVDVLGHREAIGRELDALSDARRGPDALRIDLDSAFAAYLEAGRALSGARAQAAASLSSTVTKELSTLALEKARFEIALPPRTADAPEQVSPAGLEDVRFLFSANPGEPLKPLAKIASGGELSRTMLALLTALQDAAGPATLVFDEVDAGIGGKPAERVGKRLRALAASRQVLCITHLPQIAAHAHRHAVVAKDASGTRTRVTFTPLDDEKRIEELARMLAGESVTPSARRHAAALLKAARAPS